MVKAMKKLTIDVLLSYKSNTNYAQKFLRGLNPISFHGTLNMKIFGSGQKCLNV